MSVSLAALAASAALGQTVNSGLATDATTGPAHIVPLFMERGGINTAFIGIAHPNGCLYKFATEGPRSVSNTLRELSLRAPQPVQVDNLGFVHRDSPRGPKRIGEMLDFRGAKLDVTKSVQDQVTFESRSRKFLPIALVIEDDATMSFRMSPYGTTMIREILVANGAQQKTLLAYLPNAFKGHFAFNEEEGSLVGLTPEGIAFEQVLVESITNGLPDAPNAGGEESEETPVEGAEAPAPATADYSL